MCFGLGNKPKKRAHNKRRTIKRMGQFGYGIGDPVYGSHPITQEQITLYHVVDYLGSGAVIAMLGVYDDSLIVTKLYLDRDRRGSAERPLASDVLLSFWKYFAQLPVRSLREIIFQTVKEPETKRVREHAYRVLGEGCMTTVRLRRDSQGIEEEEFGRAEGVAKLGKCVRTIATEYIEMKEGHARIAQFTYVPQAPRGAGFHFVVTLDYDR